MSLTIYLTNTQPTVVFDMNITHNLTQMASVAGLYEYLWQSDTLNITKAEQLIHPLEKGLNLLKEKPSFFRSYEPPNGWGTYEDLVRFVEEYLEACMEYPNAVIGIAK